MTVGVGQVSLACSAAVHRRFDARSVISEEERDDAGSLAESRAEVRYCDTFAVRNKAKPADRVNLVARE